MQSFFFFFISVIRLKLWQPRSWQLYPQLNYTAFASSDLELMGSSSCWETSYPVESLTRRHQNTENRTCRTEQTTKIRATIKPCLSTKSVAAIQAKKQMPDNPSTAVKPAVATTLSFHMITFSLKSKLDLRDT